MKHQIADIIQVRGRLIDFSKPQVMGILNATPDSFYAGSRKQTEREIAERSQQIVAEGGTMIDIGGFSTRPGAMKVSEEEEKSRLRFALGIVRREVPDAVVSVDTWRPAVARQCVEEWGADIINDVSEGVADFQSPATRLCDAQSPRKEDGSLLRPMFDTVARLQVPYILMSVQPTMRDMLLAYAAEVQQLRDLGVKDIILDPGFGFGKTLEQNYQVLSELERLLVLELPVLVGASRKSMIYQLLGGDPTTALNGTTVVNTLALMKGASILRVHDVREAVEAVKIVCN